MFGQCLPWKQRALLLTLPPLSFTTREKKPKQINLLLKQRNLTAAGEEPKKFEIRHQCGKGTKREIMAHSPDSYFLAGDERLCVSDNFPEKVNTTRAQQRGAWRQRPHPSADPWGTTDVLTAQTGTSDQPPYTFQTSLAVDGELHFSTLLSQMKSVAAGGDASRSRTGSDSGAIALLPALLSDGEKSWAGTINASWTCSPTVVFSWFLST